MGAPIKEALSVLSLKGNRRNELEQVRKGWVCQVSKTDQYQQNGEGVAVNAEDQKVSTRLLLISQTPALNPGDRLGPELQV